MTTTTEPEPEVAEAAPPVRRTAKERKLITAADKARAATVERDRLIRELRADGKSYRYIAELCEISHTQVSNICRAEPAAA